MTLALGVYLRANVPNKVIAYFAETGKIEKIAPYSKKVGYIPDYSSLLQHITRINPEKGAEFASRRHLDVTKYHELPIFARRQAYSNDGLQPEDMLRVNIRQKLQVVIQIATKHSDILGSVKLIEMFEYFKTFEGLYYTTLAPSLISATTRTGQICEAERIYRESNHYKNFLKGAKLPDQLPLIIVYDRFDFVHDLVLYLYQNKLTKFIEVQDPAVFNALAKIFIDSNNKPETFLKKNNLYEPLVVGNFCEARDLYLAYITYAKGFCDDELIDIINDNSIFKQAASSVPRETSALIDQIVATALPECTDLDDVSVTVKAFLLVDLPIEVIKLREKVVIEPSPFNKGKVVGFINKLQNHEAGEIAKIATDHGLYEQALTIYKKYDQLAMASVEQTCQGSARWSSHQGRRWLRTSAPPTSLGPLKFRVTLQNMMILFASSKWLVGQKCFEYELYQAAKLLPTSISNWSRLATTLIYLGENEAAVGSARKAQFRSNLKFMLHASSFFGDDRTFLGTRATSRNDPGKARVAAPKRS
ncbi:armadillo-type protein [Suillus cothurnatus]|nr:armadillo-type protein [Suillus cothurnatus]